MQASRYRKESKILMIFFFFWLLGREPFSILTEYPDSSLQHTHSTFPSGSFHPPERTVLSPSYSVSKSYSVSTTAALPRKARWKARAWLPWDFKKKKKNVQPQLKMQKEAGAGGVSSSGCLGTTNKPVTEGLLLWGSTASWVFGARHPSE